MSDKTPLKIIVVASDGDSAKKIAAMVNRAGYAVKGKFSPNIETLTQALSSQLWDAVLVSEPVPDEMTLAQVCGDVKHHDPATPVIVIGANGDDSARTESLKQGASDHLSSKATELLGLVLKRELEVRPREPEAATDFESATAPQVTAAPDTSALQAEEQVWLERIQTALAQDRFTIAYQPIVNLNAEPAPNYELLLRMLDDQNKEIAPGAFISSAEKAGMMGEIDRWVVKHAVTTLEQRQRNDSATRFFVKLSTASLLDEGFIPWLANQLHGVELQEESLVFEITEADAIEHEQRTKALIPALAQLKCRSALDHVGLAPNSHEFWIDLTPDYIKLSGRLVRNLSENRDDQAAITRLAGYAKSHKIQTIAQFVQDPASLAFLWQRGINYIQGYYLQRPDAELNYDFTQEV